MKIKTSDLFCASPASTAICTTMNHHAMVRRSGGSTPRSSSHRHNNYYNNHYQFDFGDKPKFKTPSIPCTSQQHIDPKPYIQKPRKSTSSAAPTTGKHVDQFPVRRKSSAELNDRSSKGGSSSRCLLNNIFLEDLKDSSDVCNAGALVVSEQAWPDDHDVVKKSFSSRGSWREGYDSPALVKSRSSSMRLHATAESPGSKSLRSPHNQVVELRVSIHCKGCEGKVRKHISRMEGVKSFHIDLELKKVTVVGDITPLSVLSSISKVKSAQLWPSPSPSSSSSSSSSPSPFIAIGY
ncbi:putative heavy metal-associated domain, HMA, heavy metal-associated domain superfamily [Helianthus annuus]|nr:putative heavy metal-associated domain, HMA, heavy metal-associated domain superfamily [Helianthus annuus]